MATYGQAKLVLMMPLGGDDGTLAVHTFDDLQELVRDALQSGRLGDGYWGSEAHLEALNDIARALKDTRRRVSGYIAEARLNEICPRCESDHDVCVCP